MRKPPIIAEITQHPSPNRSSRGGVAIDTIVLHATAGSYEGALAWLTSPRPRVSAHYLIDKFGNIAQLVPIAEKAWHAGRSVFKGRYGMNASSVGIELANANDGQDPYPLEQVDSCAILCAWLCAEQGIPTDRITSHAAISGALQGKTDPRGFDWERFSMTFRAWTPSDREPREEIEALDPDDKFLALVKAGFTSPSGVIKTNPVTWGELAEILHDLGLIE